MNALIASTPASGPSFDTAFDTAFDLALPRGLGRGQGSSDPAALMRRFGSANGPLRVGSWSYRPARGGRTTFDATFGISDTIHTASATAYGPVEALTSMLYDAGFGLEILSFHQQPGPAGRTVTFALCEFDGRQEWSMAIEGDSMQSSIRAVVGAANTLHG